MLIHRAAFFLLLTILSYACTAQDTSGKADAPLNFPSRFFSRVQHKTSNLDEQLTRQTEKYLQRIQRRELRLYRKLYKVDSLGAKGLFGGAMDRYADLGKKLASDTGAAGMHLSDEYQAYTDSLQGMLKFMKDPQAAGTLAQLKTLEGRMSDADQIKAYIRERKQQISQYIQQHKNLAGLLGKDYQEINRSVHYYSEQVRQYREMLNDPDKLEKQALAILNKLPSFQQFMRTNGQLAGLFNVPGNYADPSSLVGLQTRDQVAAIIRQQISSAGSGGAAALQANLQSAQSQLASYKDKLSKLGSGSGDMDMPDFKPRNLRTKPLWQRLEWGTNLQTSRTNPYYPNILDLGFSLGYRLGDKSTIGIGSSLKIGLGNGIQHLSVTVSGASLRSFLDIAIHGSFLATAGLEYNHTNALASFQDIRQLSKWTASGLVGITKTVSLKSRVFKKTRLQLLWDYLSYSQIPRTQPLLYRIGYNF
ncbi:MAG: hypothetical protein BGO55_21500 [Sphingobacteriales bacterium 50-39]|nr:hypothetical protein [Sphingobacteriales bacterium]OJW59567.1 MAG: hypothetical protein BGO55_21500 [Sphingobacteriales bacterium 50-39]